MKGKPWDMDRTERRRDYTKHLMDYYSIGEELKPCPKCKGEVYLRSCTTSKRKLVKCMNCGFNKVEYDCDFTNVLKKFYTED